MADIKFVIDVDDDGKIKKATESIEGLGSSAEKTGGSAFDLGSTFSPSGDLTKNTFSFGEASDEVTGSLGMMFEQMAGGTPPMDSFRDMVSGLGGVLGPVGAIAVPAMIAGLVALAPMILENTNLFESFGKSVEKAGESMDGAVTSLASWQGAIDDGLGPEISNFAKTVLKQDLIESSEEANKVMTKLAKNFDNTFRLMKKAGRHTYGDAEEIKRMTALEEASLRIQELGELDTSNARELKSTLEVVTFILEEQMSGALEMNGDKMEKLIDFGEKLRDMIEQIGDGQEVLDSALNDSLRTAQQIGTVSGGSATVQAYANGGVVNRATSFTKTDGSLGVMGEAGPEAILPLKRGSDGKLGVAMDGGSSSGGVVINQTFSFSANGDDSVKKIIAQEAPRIAKMTEQSIINSRQRGGSIRKVFG